MKERLKIELGSVRKTVKRFKTAIGFAMVGILTAAVMFCGAPKVKASAGQLNNVITVSIPPQLQTNAATVTNTSGTAFTVPAGSDLIIQTTITPANNGTSNWMGGIDFTVDGAQFTTGRPLLLSNVCQGSNVPVSWITYVSRTNFSGASQGIFDWVTTTQTNNVGVVIKIGSVIP